MTTSANTSWELQSTALVNAAYRKIGYIAEGVSLSPTALAQGVEALNAIISLMETKGMPLWKRNSITFTPLATTQQFNVPNAIKIAQVVLINNGGSQYPLVEKSRYDFNMLPANSGPGVPVHYEVRTLNPLTSGMTVNIWPYTADTGTISNSTVQIWYQKIFDGMFNATDTLDFPAHWTQGIIYKLAQSLAPESGLPLQDRNMLKGEADEAIKASSDYGDEDGSLLIQPSRYSYGR